MKNFFFAQLLTAILACLFFASCNNQDNKSTEVLEDETFKNPPEARSQNGVLNLTLKPEEGKYVIGKDTFDAWMYNGLYCPPLLHLQPKDTLNLTLINGVQMETNLHFHGFDVSPLGRSDNIFNIVNPNDSFQYQIILPDEHDAGTFWYHPHPCGKSEQQVFLGMSGGIIIDGLFDELNPEFKNIKDRTLLLKDIQKISDQKKIILCSPTQGTKEVYDFDSNAPTTRTVNGQLNPTIVIQPNETQLLRISNVGANIYYNIMLEGHKLNQIGEDGGYYKKIISQDSVLIPPGGRIEVLVQGAAAGKYALKTLAMSTGPDGDSYPETTLATIVCQGDAVKKLTIPTNLSDDITDYRTLKQTGKRKFVFTEKQDPDRFYINDSMYKKDRIDTKVKLGSIEEWTLVNEANEAHVFHIHQLDYQVIEVNGKPVGFNGYDDVINLPAKSITKIIIPFTEPYLIGKFVYHCHILAHEDRGMMQVIEIVK